MLSTICSEKYDYNSINLYIGKKITYFPPSIVFLTLTVHITIQYKAEEALKSLGTSKWNVICFLIPPSDVWKSKITNWNHISCSKVLHR